MADIWLPDPRFEMPELLIPGRKPTGPVVIDAAHPLAEGLVVSTVFNDNNPKNMISGEPWATVGSDTINVDKRRGVDNTNTSAYSRLSLSIPTPYASHWIGGPDWTLFMDVRNDGSPSQSFYYFAATGSFASGHLIIYGQTGSRWHAGTDTGGSRAIVYEAFESSEYYQKPIVMRSKSGVANSVFYGDGQKADSGGVPVAIDQSKTTLYLLSRDSSGTFAHEATCNYFHLWDRALTDGECRSLLKDPYQFVMPA